MDEQLLSGDLLERVARVGVEHVERLLLAERLCLVRIRRGCLHAVALLEVKVRLNRVRRRRVGPGVMDVDDRFLCNRIEFRKFCWCVGKEGERRKAYPCDRISSPIVPKPVQIVCRFCSVSTFFMNISDPSGPNLSAAEMRVC